MDSLSGDFVESVRRGAPNAEALEVVGEPDPQDAAEYFRQAAGDPLLSTHLSAWCAPLLRSARPGRGAHRLAELSAALRERGIPLGPERLAAIAPVLGSSDFLSRLLAQNPEWVTPPGRDEGTGDAPLRADFTAIREFKYRGLLDIAIQDLANRPFRESLAALSRLADRCLEAAMRATAEQTEAPEPALLALGKLGGCELNFSSDVDVLFLYDSPEGEDDRSSAQNSSRFIRHFKKACEAPEMHGFLYRVDLDLRPEGRSGVLANSVTAALDYYEAFGAEWERQMLIRLRHVAGPESTSSDFAEGIRPFVYRRSIDAGALDHVRHMKERIETERREAGRDLEYELKEGPGGIRDVEFLVQALQMFWGGREPELRTGNTLDALEALNRKSLLDDDATAAVSDAYLWLRRAEHSLQLVDERQTHRFPRDAVAQTALARRMGYPDARGDAARTSLLDDWTMMKGIVRHHFDSLVLRVET